MKFDVRLPNGMVIRGIPEGTTRDEILSRAVREGWISPEESRSGLEKALIGAGRAVTEFGQGVGQLVGVGDPRAQAAEAATYEAGLGEDTAAQIGRLGGHMAMSLVPGGIGTAAARGLGGAMLRQLATGGAVAGAVEGLAQPVYGGSIPAGKVASTLTGAVTGLGAGAATRAGIGAINTLRPSNLVTRAVAVSPAKLREGRRLTRRTGVELPLGAESGSKGLIMAENAARQSFFTADRAFAVDEKIANQVLRYFDRIMDGIESGSVSAGRLGRSVQGAVRTAVKNIINRRDADALADFGKLRGAVGEVPVMLRNAQDEARRLLGRYEGVFGSEAQSVSSQMARLVEQLSEPMDINQALRNRSYFSRLSKGLGNLFKDVQDKSLTREIGARMAAAIERDFDELPGLYQGEIGDMLRAANRRYQGHMQAIELIEKSALGRVLGDDIAEGITTIAPEKAAEALMRIPPSQVALARSILETHAPDVLREWRRYAIERAVVIGRDTAAATEGVRALPINATRTLNAITKYRTASKDPYLRALFDGRELSEIDSAIDVLRRWNDRFGFNWSGTAPMNMLMSVLRGGLRGSLESVGAIGLLNRFASMMENPAMRREVLRLKKIRPGPKAMDILNSISAYLAGGVGAGAAAATVGPAVTVLPSQAAQPATPTTGAVQLPGTERVPMLLPAPQGR